MNEKTRAKLYGGPFDGDSALIEVVPTEIWVEWGEDLETAWYSIWTQGAERYRAEDVNEVPVKYVYCDMPGGPLLTEEVEDSVPA